MIWHGSSSEDVCSELKVDSATGLFSDEADKRLEHYGKNQLTAKEKKSIFKRLAEQFTDFMVVILLIAAAVSLITTVISGENNWIEPIVIIAIVIVNALLGVLQESKAEAALEALKNMAAPQAKVRRDRVIKVIPATELVPGDIIILEAGDYIPADGRLIEVGSLHCDESALTGESVPTEKLASEVLDDITPIGDRINMVYSGCAVSSGRGVAVVTATGMDTEIGRIATMIDSVDDGQTPLKAKLANLGKTLGIIALVICAVIFVFGAIEAFVTHQPMAEKLLELFMTSVSLAVAAIPEGLPAIVTVVLALGVRKMVKNNAIVRKLPAVETLGSASVICSDKTGTLTQNKMTVVKVFDGRKITDLTKEEITHGSANLLTFGAICCDGTVKQERGKEIAVGDPTETGIVSAAMKYTGHGKDEFDNTCPRLGEIPFDSERKMMTTVNMIDGKVYAIVKGAPDMLIPRCDSVDAEAALAANDAMAKEALRVIGVAYKVLPEVPVNLVSEEIENGLTFVGLIGMIDPPRPEVIDAIRLCKKSGIRTVMITGDHIVTAAAIAKQLGMMEDGRIAVTGAALREMSDDELFDKIESIDVYARVSPEDKIRIVEAWKRKGETVAMTGDGVNDAPALSAADIGCAMGITGTDVAKGAADMTLTDDNFATIVTAVKEGRGIYDNIRKSVHFLLSCNLGEVLSVFFGMIFTGGSPLAAVQLLWLNLVTDSAPALALGTEPPEYDVMDRKPRSKKESIFAGGLGIAAVWQGAMFAALTLIAFAVGKASHGGDIAYGSTFAFAVLSFGQIIHSFNTRSLHHSVFKIGFFKNKNIWVALLISVALMLIALLTPLRSVLGLAALGGKDWLKVILLSLVPLAVCELEKQITPLVKKLIADRRSK